MTVLSGPDRAPSLLGGGWAFFVPYLLAYLLALILGLTCGELRWLFWLGHGLLALGMIACIARAVRHVAFSTADALPWGAIVFWLLLLAAFWLPGAYLEFPGDPWEHVRRLNSWRAEDPISTSTWASRFAYFWGWSFVSLAPPAHQRALLDALSAFWQVLLAWQLYLFARRLGFSRGWSRVQVLAVIALFGNSVFGFFRYYALSSTPLAYVAYLRAARAVLDVVDRRGPAGRSALILVAALGLIGLNHPQEMLLFTVFAGTVLALESWSRRDRRRRARDLLVIGTLLLVALLVGRMLMRTFLASPAPATWFGYPFVSRFATFRLWDPSLAYFRTLGAQGVVAFIVAVVAFRLHPRIAALTVTPPLLLSFPPFALLFASLTAQSHSYRLLFLLPAGFMIVTALRAGAEALRPGRRALGQGVAVALVLVLGAISGPPVYGKLRFQIHRPHALLAASDIDRVAEWFVENRKLGRRCIVTSDPVTEWVVAAWLGREPGVERVSGFRWLTPRTFGPWSLRGTGDLLNYGSIHTVCGYLVMDRSRQRADRDLGPRSWVGALSGHWAPDAASAAARVPPGLVDAAEGLTSRGWRRTFVPPAYWYYEPPGGDTGGRP